MKRFKQLEQLLGLKPRKINTGRVPCFTEEVEQELFDLEELRMAGADWLKVEAYPNASSPEADPNQYHSDIEELDLPICRRWS